MEMLNLGIHYEQDDEGKDTGRVQVADEDGDYVLETFDTEKEAEEYMAKLKAEEVRNEQIKAEYLEWEVAILEVHKITQDELRHYLVNYVCL
jgi:hypothetical protein